MKHIAFFLHNLGDGGGTERMTISLANSLQQRGYSITLISLCNYDKPYFNVDENIKIFQILKDENSVKNLTTDNKFDRFKVYAKVTHKLNKIIKQNKIEILINSSVQNCQWSLPIKIWNKKIKIISWEHFNAKIKWFLFVRGREMSRKYADAIVVLTQQDKELYLEEGNSKSPIYVINNFVDKYPDETASLESKNVLAVGRIDYIKGLDLMVDVWKQVKQSGFSTGWKLYLVGSGTNEEEIRNLILDKKLEDSIVMSGATHNVEQYYMDASIYVMTSRVEGFGLVLVEAQSFGLPTISFDCPTGPREIINNGNDGFLVDSGDNDTMVEKILLLMQDENLRKEMGKKAKENSVRFRKEYIVDKWEELFESLDNKE